MTTSPYPGMNISLFRILQDVCSFIRKEGFRYDFIGGDSLEFRTFPTRPIYPEEIDDCIVVGTQNVTFNEGGCVPTPIDPTLPSFILQTQRYNRVWSHCLYIRFPEFNAIETHLLARNP